MTKYEQIFLNGIPFLLDAVGTVFIYTVGKDESIAIGSYNRDSKCFTMSDDWEARVNPLLNSWRAHLTPTERGKVRETYKPAKQGRSRKTTGKRGTA